MGKKKKSSDREPPSDAETLRELKVGIILILIDHLIDELVKIMNW